MTLYMCFSAVFSRPRPFVCGLICCSAWLCFFQLPVRADQAVALTWDAVGDPAVAGYRIYYGVQSRIYSRSVDVGKVTKATIAGLAAGMTYYFAATSYYDSGDESDYSNETKFIVPADVSPPPTNFFGAVSTTVTNPAALTEMNRSGGHFNFTVSGAAGSFYILEASTNLVNWAPVRTNIAPFVFEAGDTGLPQQFFRAVGAVVTMPANGVISAEPFSGQSNFNVSGIPGFSYVVEASADLVNWLPVQTNIAPFTFAAPGANLTEQHYRAAGIEVVGIPGAAP